MSTSGPVMTIILEQNEVITIINLCGLILSSTLVTMLFITIFAFQKQLVAIFSNSTKQVATFSAIYLDQRTSGVAHGSVNAHTHTHTHSNVLTVLQPGM